MKNSQEEPLPGVLYVVATPIGNLDDITLRAIRILGGVDWVAAEDTRRTRILMSRHNLGARLISLNADAEDWKAPALIDSLEQGESGAVVSDAGTPGASDPGGRLVAAAAARGLRVAPVPGPSAVAAAFSVSGFESPRFVFEGFFPRSGTKRKQIFEALAAEERHVIFFESAKRIQATLSELHEYLGDRGIVVLREITKIHEEIIRGRLAQLAENKLILKEIGEYTIVVEGAPRASREENIEEGVARAAAVLARTALSTGEIARIVTELFGGSKNEIYELVVKARDGIE